MIDSENWLKRVAAIRRDIAGNFFLRDYLLHENEVAFELEKFSHQKRNRGTLRIDLDSVACYEAAVFITQFLDFHDKLPIDERKSLRRRVQSSFSNPDDLRAIKFEWLIAVHLSKRGFEIDFPRLMGAATCDLLATKGAMTMEVECKSISNDKGRQIHRREALDVHHLIYTNCKAFLSGLSTGLVIRVIVARRLPNRYLDRIELAKTVRKMLLSSSSIDTPALKINLNQFDIASSPFVKREMSRYEIEDFLKKRFAIFNKEVFMRYSPGKNAFVLSLESLAQEDIVASALEVASDACDRQLSNTMPGVICIKFEDLSSAQLRDIGFEQGEPTNLRRQVSNFLDRRTKSHLVCLSFFANGELVKYPDRGVSREGASYFFENPTSPMYNVACIDAFRDLQ